MNYSTIGIIVSLFSLLGGIWGISKSFRADIDKVFQRFDDHKASVDKKLFILQDISDNKYIRADMCSLTKETFKEEFNRINQKLDTLLTERRT